SFLFISSILKLDEITQKEDVSNWGVIRDELDRVYEMPRRPLDRNSASVRPHSGFHLPTSEGGFHLPTSERFSSTYLNCNHSVTHQYCLVWQDGAGENRGRPNCYRHH